MPISLVHPQSHCYLGEVGTGQSGLTSDLVCLKTNGNLHQLKAHAFKPVTWWQLVSILPRIGTRRLSLSKLIAQLSYIALLQFDRPRRTCLSLGPCHAWGQA